MSLPTLTLIKQDLAYFDEAIQKEWLITNGLGGYSSSTVLGVNTRKYHGLLVAALNPPGNRTVCLSKMDEELHVGNEVYLLGANEFNDAFFPKGFLHLTEFSVTPFPKYGYSAGNVKLEKTIFMPQNKNVTVIVYNVLNENNFEVKMTLTPLLTCRHYHFVMEKSKSQSKITQNSTSSEVQASFNRSTISVKLTMRATDGEFREKPNWVERIVYREDEIRGESGVEDGYQPGAFEFAFSPRSERKFAVMTAVSENFQTNLNDLNCVGKTVQDCEKALNRELGRRNNLVTDFFHSNKTVPQNNILKWVLSAADSFIVKDTHRRKAVIAGYHWYEPWGRDTFISFPGLLLVTGRFQDGRRILVNFTERSKNGLIPNFINDKTGEAAYNTVDASMWYINATLQYLKYTADFEFVRTRLWENLKAIIEGHIKGTDYGIHLDSDGLISHGPRLTWMDAEVNGKPMTPREGKAVEIQALWYNALRIVQLLAEKFEEKSLAVTYTKLAEKAQISFNQAFWNSEKNCLYDVLETARPDASVRSNQMIAASLDFPILNKERALSVLDLVQSELLTPCGLRTLARYDPKYRGKYFGNRQSRDEAYHNGTVWPWLLGPFVTAFSNVRGRSGENLNYLKHQVESFFFTQINRAGLGTFSEIFDGDSPHRPRGCISQAWSVAEPFRAYVEDVLQVRPRFERQVLPVQA